jgi:hypothetical protein
MMNKPMRFELYTDKTIAQCVRLINERLLLKETKSRPAIDGWVDKSGRFSISMQGRVYKRFNWRTRMRAHIERQAGLSVVQGVVPSGLSPNGIRLVVAGFVIFAVYLLSQQQVVAAIVLGFITFGITIPLQGDYKNHDLLLYELERTLEAKPAPPKKPAKK